MASNDKNTMPAVSPEVSALADCIAIILDDLRRKRDAEKMRREDAQPDRTQHDTARADPA